MEERCASPDYEQDIEKVEVDDDEEEEPIRENLQEFSDFPSLSVINVRSLEEPQELVELSDDELRSNSSFGGEGSALTKIKTAREQERRRNLSKCYQYLRKLIPKDLKSGASRSKVQTLSDTKEFILRLEKEDLWHSVTIERLMQRNFWLKYKLAKLKQFEEKERIAKERLAKMDPQ